MKRRHSHATRRALLRVLLAACVAGGCAAPADPDPGADRDVLRVGVNPFIGYAPLYYADAVDLCATDGLDLEVVEAADPSLLDAQFRAGELDAAAFTNTTLVRNVAGGLELQAFLPLDFSKGADGIVAAGSGVTIADLVREQTEIAADVGDTAYFVLLVAAAAEDFDVDDFNLVQMTTDAAATAFVSGQVDAAGLFEPFLSRAARRPGTSLVVTTADHPAVISDLFVAPPDVIEERRETLRLFANCWYRAVEDVEELSSETARAIAEALRIDAGSVAEQARTVTWPDRDAGSRYLLGPRLRDLLEFSSSLYADLGLVDDEVDVSKLVSDDVIEPGTGD